MLIIAWFIFNFLSLLLGSYQVFSRKNPFGKCLYFILNGSYVWGDAVIFGLFWIILSVFFYYSQNQTLFFIAYSLFWLIRSLGEMVYWLNQQFTTQVRDQPETLFLSRYFPYTSVWFIYQIIHQCIAVIAGISLIYFIKQHFIS